MKASWPALHFALGLLASPVALRAQSTGAPPSSAAAPDPSDDLRQEMTKLVLADASRQAKAAPTKTGPSPAASGVILMDPYIVRESRDPTVIIPHYQSPIARFLSTGTIVQIETKRTSMKISAAVDSGPGGYAKPAIKFNLNW